MLCHTQLTHRLQAGILRLEQIDTRGKVFGKEGSDGASVSREKQLVGVSEFMGTRNYVRCQSADRFAGNRRATVGCANEDRSLDKR